MLFVLWLSCWLAKVLEQPVEEVQECVSTLREMQLRWVNKCRERGVNPFTHHVEVTRKMVMAATLRAPSWIQGENLDYYLIPTEPDSREKALNFVLYEEGVWEDIKEWKILQETPQIGDNIFSVMKDGRCFLRIWTPYWGKSM